MRIYIRRISRFVSLGALIVFLLVIGFFRVFGGSIRDNSSPHVMVTPVAFYLFEGDDHSTIALPNDCFIYDDITGETALFYVEKNPDSGEDAFFAVKMADFKIGRTEGLYTELGKCDWINKEFIYKSDRHFSNRDRVVVVKEGKLQ